MGEQMTGEVLEPIDDGFDKKTGDAFVKHVSGLFGDMPDFVRQRHLKALLVLVWRNLSTTHRRAFVGRLNGIEFDDAPLDIKSILSDWDRVVAAHLSYQDRKFADDIQWRRKKHKFYSPKAEDQQQMRAIHASVMEQQ